MTDAGAVTIDPPPRSGRRGRSRGAWPSRIAHVAVFGLIAEVAFVHLGNADAAPDEFTYRTCGEAYVHGGFTCNLEHPLLAKEILGLGSFIFGNTLAGARATTGCIALATALFCYLFVTDAAGRVAGLGAAALWGLLPQAGIEDHTTLEAVRVDRFALLDPYVACFFAAALFAGARCARRGGVAAGAWCGAAVAAAACAKAPGILIAPVVCGAPLVARWRASGRFLREAAAMAVGAVVVVCASYAPLGPGGAVRAIRYMFDFQTTHASREVVVGGHFYVQAPWWSDLAFATSALTIPVMIGVVGFACAGLLLRPRTSAYPLLASASVVIGVGFGLHLSAPHYFVDWEPGVVIAAALGASACVRARSRAVVAAPALAAVVLILFGVVRTVAEVNTLTPGPYAGAARAMRCETTCFVAYVGFLDVYSNYLPENAYLSAVPPSTRHGIVVARFPSGGGVVFLRPDVIALDPAAYVLHGSWRRSIAYFTAHARALGYRELPTGTRIAVYRRVAGARVPPAPGPAPLPAG